MSKASRSILILLSSLAVILPGFLIISNIVSSETDSGFVVLLFPILAIPMLAGLVGLKLLSKKQPQKPTLNHQIANGLIYAGIIVVLVLLALGCFIWYEISNDTKPQAVSYKSALNDIKSCNYIDISQSKKPDPSKGIVFNQSKGVFIVYDDSEWSSLVTAAKAVSGSKLDVSNNNCPNAIITPRNS